MIPPEFDYARPADLDAALRALHEREGEAKVLAGGMSLLPLMRFRLAQPALLIDLGGIKGLDGIREDDEWLHIGAMTTHRTILEDPIVAARYPLLREAASGIGDPQVRNWGTMGGSIVHADPAADWPAVLVATSAVVHARSADAERDIPAREFFIDVFTTACEPTEIVTEIRFGVPPARSGGAYENIERRAGDFSSVGVAVQLSLRPDGKIDRAGIGLTAVADVPFAATDAEGLLAGAAPDDDLVGRVAAAASAQSQPASDAHGPADYKRAMVAELTARALRRALARAAA